MPEIADVDKKKPSAHTDTLISNLAP